MAEQSLAGRTALVTGASGAIGSAIASQLAAAGANLLVHYNSNAEAAGKLAQAISERGGQARPVRGRSFGQGGCRFPFCPD